MEEVVKRHGFSIPIAVKGNSKTSLAQNFLFPKPSLAPQDPPMYTMYRCTFIPLCTHSHSTSLLGKAVQQTFLPTEVWMMLCTEYVCFTEAKYERKQDAAFSISAESLIVSTSSYGCGKLLLNWAAGRLRPTKINLKRSHIGQPVKKGC